MCAVIIAALLIGIGLSAYYLWMAGNDVSYWMDRCLELDEQLKHITDLETIEAIAKKTKAYDSGISVNYDN